MSETLLSNGSVVETPNVFRITITLPMELKGFVETRAKRYSSLRGDKNTSAYFRTLAVNDQRKMMKRRTGGARRG